MLGRNGVYLAHSLDQFLLSALVPLRRFSSSSTISWLRCRNSTFRLAKLASICRMNASLCYTFHLDKLFKKFCFLGEIIYSSLMKHRVESFRILVCNFIFFCGCISAKLLIAERLIDVRYW